MGLFCLDFTIFPFLLQKKKNMDKPVSSLLLIDPAC